MSRRPADGLSAHLRRFSRDEGGVYAVEFAFFGTLLVILVMVLLQYAIVFLARQNLDNAMQVAKRSLLTGNFQKANAGSTDQAKILSAFRAQMCGTSAALAIFYTCDNLKVDVQVSGTFNPSSSSGSAVDGSTGDWTKGFGTTYVCPSPQSIAVVRAAVKLPLFVPMFNLGFPGFSGNAALLQSAAVFRVEPYQGGSAGTC
ncbi:MAG: pilus assembly protein [Methylorubrum populi]